MTVAGHVVFLVDRWINAGCINMWFPGAWWKSQANWLKSSIFRYRDRKSWLFKWKYLAFSSESEFHIEKLSSSIEILGFSIEKNRFFYGNTRFFKNMWQMTSIYIEWQQVTTSESTNDNEWQRMTTSGTTKDNEWKRMTTSDNGWQRAAAIDNDWQSMTASGTTNESE